MKEKHIFTLFGMDIVARTPVGYSKELGDEIQELLQQRASDFLEELVNKRLKMSTDEELKLEVGIKPRRTLLQKILNK